MAPSITSGLIIVGVRLCVHLGTKSALTFSIRAMESSSCMFTFSDSDITCNFFYEALLETVKLLDPTNCVFRDDGTCVLHSPHQMLQIFSLKLDKIHVDGGLVELYGYIAARDRIDRLLNHVVNFSRDDPIIVQQVLICNYFKLLLFVSEYKTNHTT